MKQYRLEQRAGIDVFGSLSDKSDISEYIENHIDMLAAERLELLKRDQTVCSQKTKQMKNYNNDEL